MLVAVLSGRGGAGLAARRRGGEGDWPAAACGETAGQPVKQPAALTGPNDGRQHAQGGSCSAVFWSWTRQCMRQRLFGAASRVTRNTLSATKTYWLRGCAGWDHHLVSSFSSASCCFNRLFSAAICATCSPATPGRFRLLTETAVGDVVFVDLVGVPRPAGPISAGQWPGRPGRPRPRPSLAPR